jgi:hypothetical protein
MKIYKLRNSCCFLFAFLCIQFPVLVECRQFDPGIWKVEGTLHYTGWAAWNRKWNQPDAEFAPGTASLTTDKTTICGEKVNISIVYSPHETISIGGSFVIGTQMIWNAGRNFGSIQADDSTSPGFTTFECSRSKVSLELHTIKQTFETNFIEVFVRKGEVSPEDTISIHIRDYPVGQWDLHQFFFVLAVDAKGDVQYKRIKDLPFLTTYPAAPDRLLLSGPSSVKKSGTFDLTLTAMDCFGNRAKDYRGTVALRPSIPCKNLPSKYTFTEKDQGNRTFLDIRPEATGYFTITAKDKENEFHAISNPMSCEFQADGYPIYFGDIHGHTILSDAVGTPEEYYWWGRNVENLDFAALSDHAEDRSGIYEWNKEKIQWYQKAQKEYHDPGDYITFYTFEWTGGKPYGHHNFYFRDGVSWVIPADKQETDELWEALQLLKDSTTVVIPHHPKTQVSWIQPEYKKYSHRIPVVEMCSNWGSSEDRILFPMGGTARDALAAGLKLGFIGSSDTHNGRAGSLHDGLVAVLPEKFSRKGILSALRARRCYATSGEKILLDFHINEALMGEELKIDSVPEITFQVIGTASLRTIELIRDNRIIHAWTGDGDNPPLRLRWGWESVTVFGPPESWKGQLDIENGKFGNITPNHFEDEMDKLVSVSDTRLVWESFTRIHDVDSIEVEIANQDHATLQSKFHNTTWSVPLSELDSRTRTFSQSPQMKVLEVSRLHPLNQIRYSGRLLDQDCPPGEHSYYLRVIQQDEEMAWSSPIWVNYHPSD